MTTSVPNSPQELLKLNTELTPEELFDKWCELPYEDQDNFIFKLLVFKFFLELVPGFFHSIKFLI